MLTYNLIFSEDLNCRNEMEDKSRSIALSNEMNQHGNTTPARSASSLLNSNASMSNSSIMPGMLPTVNNQLRDFSSVLSHMESAEKTESLFHQVYSASLLSRLNGSQPPDLLSGNLSNQEKTFQTQARTKNELNPLKRNTIFLDHTTSFNSLKELTGKPSESIQEALRKSRQRETRQVPSFAINNQVNRPTSAFRKSYEYLRDLEGPIRESISESSDLYNAPFKGHLYRTDSSTVISKQSSYSNTSNDTYNDKKRVRKKSSTNAFKHSIRSSTSRQSIASIDSIRSGASSNSTNSRKIRQIVSSLPYSLRVKDNESGKYTLQKSQQNPQSYYEYILKSKGCNANTRASLSSDSFFHIHTREQVDSYDHDIIAAIRSEDVQTLREMHQNGRLMTCCNNFGESLIHMACRRGFTEVVTFLLKEAGVSLRVRDDYGRTPLHDACWTCTPNFELMDILIDTDPDLLLMSDKRGHSPLQYVRREHWPAWMEYLRRKKEALIPRQLGLTSKTPVS